MFISSNNTSGSLKANAFLHSDNVSEDPDTRANPEVLITGISNSTIMAWSSVM
jgi:hypothetical protein